MKKSILLTYILVFIFSCNNQSAGPDVSAVKVDLTIKRFDRDFFKADTNRLEKSFSSLRKQYPEFLELFVNNVLGLGPVSDTNQLAFEGTKTFLRLNRRVYDTTQKIFESTKSLEKELTDGFRHLKYYYPEYKVPEIITAIGPMDALAPMSNGILTTNYMGENFIAISLQFYLGKSFSIYNDPGYISAVAPIYRSKRFSKEYIAPDVFSLVIDDLYPDSSNRLPLIERFIEKGKRMQLLHQLLPAANDTLITGYTGDQTKWCQMNERSIFNFFTQQQLLYERDPALTQNYTNEGPFTQGMPEQSPGNIGSFIGWQVVKSYLKKKGVKSPDELMKTSAHKIFQEADYQPR